MTRHRYYIGELDRYGNPVPSQAWDAVESLLLTHFGGWSRLNVDGAWQVSPQTRIYRESSRVYEVISDSEGKALATPIRDIAGQQAVLYTCEQVEGVFV